MQFIDFISRAFDLLTNFAAKNRYGTGIGVPMVVRGPSGAGVHGGPYHSQSPEMYFVKTPGLKVVAPATAADARSLLKASIRDDDPSSSSSTSSSTAASVTAGPGEDAGTLGKPRCAGAARTSRSSRTARCSGPLSRPPGPRGGRHLARDPRLRTLLPWDEDAVLTS